MVLAEDRAPFARLEGMSTGARRDALEASLLARRSLLAGVAVALAGLAALTGALVRGVLVGFDDPAATGALTPPLPVGMALTLAGAAIAAGGRLLFRAAGVGR
jgi:hypothetical protein